MTADALPPLSDADVARALNAVLAAARAEHGPRLSGLYLFGSRARGDHRPDSEADVAVVLKGTVGDLRAEKSRLIALAIDPIIDTGLQIQPWPLEAEVWVDGRTPLTYEYGAIVDVALGALDHPAAVRPTHQLAVESRLPFFAGLAHLPVREGAASGAYAEFYASLVSYQHPDHDTQDWPSDGRTP